MKTHVVIDGNAFYEIDEECMKRKEQHLKKQQRKDSEKRKNRSPGEKNA